MSILVLGGAGSERLPPLHGHAAPGPLFLMVVGPVVQGDLLFSELLEPPEV